MSQSVKICVVGPFGRMGARVVEACGADPRLHLHSVLVREIKEEDPRLKRLPEGCLVTALARDALKGADVLIDFSAPAACGQLAPECVAQSVAYVVASTGLGDAEHKALDEAALKIAVLEAANTSFGVNVLLELVQLAAQRLEGFDPEIFEIHHRHKRDAPSGTAYALGQAVAAGRSGLTEVSGRCGEEPRGENELGYGALRGGDVSGEHTVFFFGDGERLELTHRSSTPGIFATGALKAAKWLVLKKPGRYTMRDATSH